MGRTTINWNGVGVGGQKVARGAYFARVRTAGEQATTRLVMVND